MLRNKPEQALPLGDSHRQHISGWHQASLETSTGFRRAGPCVRITPFGSKEGISTEDSHQNRQVRNKTTAFARGFSSGMFHNKPEQEALPLGEPTSRPGSQAKVPQKVPSGTRSPKIQKSVNDLTRTGEADRVALGTCSVLRRLCDRVG